MGKSFSSAKKIIAGLGLTVASVLGGCDSARMGAEYWNFGNLSYEHDTHPDDRGFIKGPAGSTEVRNGYFLKIAGRENFELEEDSPWTPYVEGAVLIGYARDEEANNSDKRSSSGNSRQYTDLFPLAPQASAGIDYKVTDRFTAGIEASATAFYRESGYNRFGSDDAQKSEIKSYFQIGPTLKYRLNDGVSIDAGASAGNGNTWKSFIGLSIDF